MKSNEIQVGYFKAGKFLISIQPLPFTTLSIEAQLFFECLIFEEVDGHYNYINLYLDERFSVLKNNSELLTHNAYIERKAQSFPLWKLSRNSIIMVIDLCNKM